MKRLTQAATVTLVLAASIVLWTIGRTHAHAGRTGANAVNSTNNGTAADLKTPRDGGTLRIGQANPFQPTFIPQLMSDLPTWNIDSFAFDPLLTVDQHLKYVKDLVTDWTWSTDKRTVTMTIAKDAKWSDGVPITSADVLFTMNFLGSKIYNTTLNGQYGYVVAAVAGADRVLGAGKSFADVGGFHQIDDKHFAITFSTPDAAVLWSDIAGMVPLPQHILNHVPMQDWAASQFNKMPSVVSGPFSFVAVNGNESVEMKANDNYFRGKPHLDNVTWLTDSGNDAQAQLSNGSLDLDVMGLSVTNAASLKALASVQVQMEPELGYEYLGMKLYQKEFQDVRVRQGLLYAIDRDSLVRDTLHGGAEVINRPIANGSWAAADASDGINSYTYNPAKANDLLDQAGWRIGSDGWRIDPVTHKTANIPLDVPKGDDTRIAVARAIAEDLAKVHVKVDLHAPMDFDTLSKKIEGDDKGIYLWVMGWSLGVDPDPRGAWSKDDPYNFDRWNDSKNEGLMKQTYDISAFDPANRKKALIAWQDYVNQQLPSLFLYEPEDVYAYNHRLHIPTDDWSAVGPMNPQEWWLSP